MAEQSMVYVSLLDEGVKVYRPVTAEPVAPMTYRLTGQVPDGEVWEFQPGKVVRCKERYLREGVTGGFCLVAVAALGRE